MSVNNKSKMIVTIFIVTSLLFLIGYFIFIHFVLVTPEDMVKNTLIELAEKNYAHGLSDEKAASIINITEAPQKDGLPAFKLDPQSFRLGHRGQLISFGEKVLKTNNLYRVSVSFMTLEYSDETKLDVKSTTYYGSIDFILQKKSWNDFEIVKVEIFD